MSEKSRRFYEEIYKDNPNIKQFKGSLGYIQKFCKRYRLNTSRIHGEAASSDKVEAENFRKTKFPELIKDYVKEQIYNADETGLNYIGLPQTTLAHYDESVSGFKVSKNRVTLMTCANATGDHKLPLVFIHKYKTPRCFTTINAFGQKQTLDKSSLPVYYTTSTNAWMDMEIFEDWFHHQFVPKTRAYLRSKNLEEKAILFLDNCPAHPDELESDDGKIKCEFLPANTTALIQPMDQGVIALFKRIYKNELVRDILDSNLSVKDFQKSVVSNIKDVIFRCSNIWANLNKTVLISSWNNLGLNIEKTVSLPTFDTSTMLLYLDRCNLTAADLDMQSWFQDDLDGGPGYEFLSDEQIIDEVRNTNIGEIEEASPIDQEEVYVLEEPVISNSKVASNCEVLIKWIEKRIDCSETANSIKGPLLNLISIAKNKSPACNLQPTIASFFS